MSDNLGTGVSFVYDPEGYNYDMVVYQKGKPPLDSELNFSHQLNGILRRRQLLGLPSGWFSHYPIYTNRTLVDSFYTQNPTGANPEYALVNGYVVHVTNTRTETTNANLVQLGDPPGTGNRVNGVFLEVWQALLDPDENTNKPDPATVIDALIDTHILNSNDGWVCGENGLILRTENSGQTWSVQAIDTKRRLTGIHFITSTIGWVVGHEGTIARTASGGSRWTVLSQVVTENLNSIHAVSQLIAWAVGDSGTILKTTNGVTFVSQVSGITANLNKVYFADTLVGWAVGDSGTILKTTNGGTSWIAQTSGTTTNLNSVLFYDLNFGFAVGDGGIILRTSDGGSTWVVQSGNIYSNGAFTTTTEDLHDVTMVPTLDRLVVDEEISSQLGPDDKSFTTLHRPITKGDGNGTTTNDPADITVKVNGTAVAVDSINGTAGTVLLAEAPALNATVKVTYYYKEDCAVFTGRAWIVGTTGTVLYTDDIGAQWTYQNPQTQYDLNAASFINQVQGWIVGNNSVIRNTEDAGVTWSEQETDVFVREVQRVFQEGNIYSSVFLNDESIHPDVHIETSKRVQIQYKIRVIDNADPGSNPESGISSSILGEGPNSSGTYPYENMGSVNGDYGCWRAKCLNTVNGYCYAIPMFFVNRRNTATYNPQSNPNGSHQKNSAFIRPDLLVAENVVESDVLDVRRKVIIPSVTEFLYKTFDKLSSNTLKTNFFRVSEGGDRYGIELLQVDRVGGVEADGGTLIENATLSEIMSEDVSSEITIQTYTLDVPITTSVPSQQILGPVSGLFHYDPSQYKVTYDGSGSSYDGKPVPGVFSGFGTNTVVFTFDAATLTTNDDPSLSNYSFSIPWFDPNEEALNAIPSDPKLVKNFSGSGSPSFFYHGVLNTMTYKVIESWDSGISGYTNTARAYMTQSGDNSDQQLRASGVELHYYMRISSSNTDGSNKLKIPRTIYPDSQDVPYSVYSVRKVYNATSGFSHRLTNIEIQSSEIIAESVAGFEYINGTVVEVTISAVSDTGDSNVRNGAVVNFSSRLRKISGFNKSIIVTESPTVPITITVTNAIILGCSTTETSTSLNQHVYWVGTTMREISVTGFGTSTIQITDPYFSVGTVSIQLLIQETQLTYVDDTGNNDGLLISYNYVPTQCQGSLPTSLTVDVVTGPTVMYVSNLGSGGGTAGSPYLTPLEHIPVNDSDIETDSIFHNKIPLRFANFDISSGFVQLPVIIPGSYAGESITFSTASLDRMQRPFYSVSSDELMLTAEGLQTAVGRKIYIPMIVRVNDPTNSIFLHGEYLMVIFSRSEFENKENVTGYYANGNCSISIYRIPHRPISRV